MEPSVFIAIIALLAPFVLIISLTLAKLNARTQQERLRCEVMRAAIERGQPIPAGVLSPQTEDEDRREVKVSAAHRDIRSGIVSIGLGVGIFIFLSFFSFSVSGIQNPFKLRGWQWIGAIPVCVGAALILSSRLARKTEDPNPPALAPARRDDTRT